MRNVRSETFSTLTSLMASRAETIRAAWSVSEAAQVRSMRRASAPDAVTSSAVTIPPVRSTVVVSSLTADPPDGTSSRIVIE